MPVNGEVNQKFGIYKTICCAYEIVINAGVRFPGCPKHPNLTTIWKPVVEEKTTQTATRSELAPGVEVHIANSRLFKCAAGTLKPEAWERQHLHTCPVCQGVLCVLIRQPINNPSEEPAKPKDAA